MMSTLEERASGAEPHGGDGVGRERDPCRRTARARTCSTRSESVDSDKAFACAWRHPRLTCVCVCACVCGEANVDVGQIKKNMCSFDRKYGFANDSVRTGRHHDGSAGRGLCVVVVANGRKGRGETGVCTCMAQMSVRAAAPLAGGLAGAAVR